ncbi:PREDICTED: U-box domain-containing protein 36-like isoform X2 [Camelina sativa]|uniref:RING-type E3 ubiquitin transferase n=1 Tax=Camelina sativa TaxID=90675 RepID=A0ABM0Z9V3_CAMSA|nr:PREDICTED: U-box domain-containing protein 36-like isoform X2 [Camelina sativa]
MTLKISMATGMRETLVDEKIYVAVRERELKSKTALVWAIQNSGCKEFCIVHVHQPIQILVRAMSHYQKLKLHKKKKEKVHKNLDKYLHICMQMQVTAEIIYIEKDSVEEGILQLISQRGVRKLVMGAAADKHYSMNMRDLQSKKAIYINREAPATCQIWFTCNGYLISSREARRRDNLYLEGASSNSLSQSEITRGTESVPSSSITRGTESVPSSSITKDENQIRIQVAVEEAENSEKEAHFEAYKREEAEKAAVDAIKRAKQSENEYFEELKHRRETEKALSKAKEELVKMRSESESRIAETNMVTRKLQGSYILSMKALKRLRKELEELKIELREVSKLKSKREPPQYFICPITQDIMEDPHVAADGFTYEREAISGWFERGHETSPMINKRLPHKSLVPNLALRSAIQEWLQASSFKLLNH